MNIQYNEIDVLQNIAKQPIYNTDAAYELQTLANTYSWFGLAHILYAKANAALQQENNEALLKAGVHINQSLWFRGFLSNTSFEAVCLEHIGDVKKETPQFDYNAEAKEGVPVQPDMSWNAAGNINENATIHTHQAQETVLQENAINEPVDYLPTQISLDEEVVAEDNVLLSMHEDRLVQEDAIVVPEFIEHAILEESNKIIIVDEAVESQFNVSTSTFSEQEQTFTTNTDAEDNVLLAVREEAITTKVVNIEQIEKIAETPIIDEPVIVAYIEEEPDEISNKAIAEIEALQHDIPVIVEYDNTDTSISDKAALQIEALTIDEPVAIDYNAIQDNAIETLSDKASLLIIEHDKDEPVAHEYDYSFYKETSEDKQDDKEAVAETDLHNTDTSTSTFTDDNEVEVPNAANEQEIQALTTAAITKAIHYIPKPPTNIYAQANEHEVQKTIPQVEESTIIEQAAPPNMVVEQEPTISNDKHIPLPKIADNELIKEDTLSFEPYHTVDYFAAVGIKIDEKLLQNDRIGQQLKSFTDWLKSMKTLHPEKLVDTSLQNDAPAIEIRTIEDEEVITEAMALVYHKQGRSDKAIELLSKLSLLNPSKSAYFANQIEQIKNNTI